MLALLLCEVSAADHDLGGYATDIDTSSSYDVAAFNHCDRGAFLHHFQCCGKGSGAGSHDGNVQTAASTCKRVAIIVEYSALVPFAFQCTNQATDRYVVLCRYRRLTRIKGYACINTVQRVQGRFCRLRAMIAGHA